jgi:peptidoglycan/xylan/chitin deacetylase (PgdA/CDA1 family)
VFYIRIIAGNMTSINRSRLRLRRMAASLAVHIPAYKRRMRGTLSGMLAIPMYHGVVTEPLPVSNWCQLELSKFEEQIKFIAQEYQVMGLRDVVNRISRGLPLPDRAAVVTFDDGFRSVYTHAFPVLARYQVPFTVFLVTSLVGTDQPIWTDRLFSALMRTEAPSVTCAGRRFPLLSPRDRAAAYSCLGAHLKNIEDAARVSALGAIFAAVGDCPDALPAFRLMNWEEVAQLERSGLAHFGSHSHTHPILSRCDSLHQRREMAQSRDALLEHLGVADLFAYPNGTQDDFGQVTKQLLADSRYVGAVSTIPGLNPRNADIYEFRRVNVGATTSFEQFECSMLGI